MPGPECRTPCKPTVVVIMSAVAAQRRAEADRVLKLIKDKVILVRYSIFQLLL